VHRAWLEEGTKDHNEGAGETPEPQQIPGGTKMYLLDALLEGWFHGETHLGAIVHTPLSLSLRVHMKMIAA